MEYGYVHVYDPLKGFGFIRRSEGKDVFFHYTGLISPESSINEGVKVSFLTEKGNKGLRAIKVEVTT
ncbi:cold shock domain-containing protein [Desulfocicer niacini]